MHRCRAAGGEHSTVRRGTPSRKRSHHCSDRATRPVRGEELPGARLKSGAKCTRAARPKTAEAPQLSRPANFLASAGCSRFRFKFARIWDFH
eukprot:2477743-Pyramimonas_sp.AAC.1